MLYRELSVNKALDFRKHIVDDILPIILNDLSISDMRIKIIMDDKPNPNNPDMQAGTKKSRSKSYDYIIRFFVPEYYFDFETKIVFANIAKSVIHELRHVYQIENNLFPEMDPKTDIPYLEREWEIDAINFSKEYFNKNKETMKKIINSIEI